MYIIICEHAELTKWRGADVKQAINTFDDLLQIKCHRVFVSLIGETCVDIRLSDWHGKCDA